MTPSTRIRQVRVTARAVRRAALRHGLTPACANGLASLAGAIAHRDQPAPYTRALAIVEACTQSTRLQQWMEAA